MGVTHAGSKCESRASSSGRSSKSSGFAFAPALSPCYAMSGTDHHALYLQLDAPAGHVPRASGAAIDCEEARGVEARMAPPSRCQAPGPRPFCRRFSEQERGGRVRVLASQVAVYVAASG
eukprot:2004566-Rhodomonas_salina.2